MRARVKPLSTTMPVPTRGCVLQRCGSTPCPPSGCHDHDDHENVRLKVRVGPPGDRFEREADRIADRVVDGSEPEAGCAGAAVSVQGVTHGAGAARGDADVPPAVHDELAASGSPLDASTRTFMETRLGHDFSRVRVHDGPKAASAANALGARAWTVGRHVGFGRNQYRPRTATGRWLLAHELAHVAQQRASGHVVQRNGPIYGPGLPTRAAPAAFSPRFAVETYGCHEAPFVRADVIAAARLAFDTVKNSGCIGSAELRQDILEEFDGLSIDCEQDKDGPCGRAMRYFTQTVNIFPPALNAAKCGPLASTILHEVIHLTEWALFGHGNLTDDCETACFGWGSGDPSKCK